MTEPKKDLDTPQKIRAALFKWVIRTSYHREKDAVQDILDRIPSPDAGEQPRDEAGLREAATFVEALGPIIDLLELDGFDGEAECLRDLRAALAAHPAPARPCRWGLDGEDGVSGDAVCRECGQKGTGPYVSTECPRAHPAPAAPPESPWRPIETAPKDGTPIWLSDGEARFPLVGWWEETDEEDSVPTGWWHDAQRFFTPTHWMPLPEPPEAAQ